MSELFHSFRKRASPIYFAGTYLVAIAIYVVARVVRKRQGIDLARIHQEIPVE